MNVFYCDRCGAEMNGPSKHNRFMALEDEPAVQDRNFFCTEVLPHGLGLPLSIAGQPSRIFLICLDCGRSLVAWMLKP